MKKLSIKEISLWIDNDESLYTFFKQSRRCNGNRLEFIKLNRDCLTRYIYAKLGKTEELDETL